MAEYMNYGGRAVEVFGSVDGHDVPRLLLSDVGEKIGDYAFIEGQPVEWDGERWRWSAWANLVGIQRGPALDGYARPWRSETPSINRIKVAPAQCDAARGPARTQGGFRESGTVALG